MNNQAKPTKINFMSNISSLLYKLNFKVQGVPRNMKVSEYFKMSSSIIC